MEPPKTVFADLIAHWDYQFTDKGNWDARMSYGIDLKHLKLLGKYIGVKVHDIVTCPLELKLTKSFITLGE